MSETPLFEIKRKSPPPRPLTVSELTVQIKNLLDTAFQDVWVVGQISNVKAVRGHIYPKLKDGQSEMPAVIWSSLASRLRFKLEEGMEVVCRGKLEVYQPQGKYQLYISSVEPKGIGALELAFQQLRDKLAKEGLFAPERKRPLPKIVKNVVLITSATGAAVRDFLQVLGRRTNRINVVIVPVSVQGYGAAAEMAAAVASVNRHCSAGHFPADCIALVRGGGSKEDLWAFNEEVLVRAVADSLIPVVCGVGHEIDISLCDLAADVRALTPSQAAELISFTEDKELEQRLARNQLQLDNGIDRKMRTYRDKLAFLARHPVFQRPEMLIETRRRSVDIQKERLDRSVDKQLQRANESFGKAAAALKALSPLAVLARGYSLTKTAEGTLVHSVHNVLKGDTITTVLTDGQFDSTVD
ncbi:MAG: exodeoxyribonuclease VII large subunit [Planctomycetaceae bacterium]|jgi:exodeoxyribonuclease VII large subunit|nr:exodeoxyribonuclease VII large subunit [Planctomycetaceae bacterium]